MLCKYLEREGLYLDTSIVYLNGMSSILVLLDVLKLNIYIYIYSGYLIIGYKGDMINCFILYLLFDVAYSMVTIIIFMLL